VEDFPRLSVRCGASSLTGESGRRLIGGSGETTRLEAPTKDSMDSTVVFRIVRIVHNIDAR